MSTDSSFRVRNGLEVPSLNTMYASDIDYPSASPSLNLNFVNSTLLDPRITFTRASTATYFNSAGTLTSAAIDAPRLDYNPSTLAARGLLIEEARTNSIRNNTMVGAVAGTPGTDPTNWISQTVTGNVTDKQIVGVGVEDGINYVDIRYVTNGAVSFNVFVFEQPAQIVAADTQTWTASVYLKLQAGSLSNASILHRLMYRTSDGAAVTFNDITVTPTSSALKGQRFANTFLASGATIARVTSQVLIVATGAIDITLRIGLPQLELGAFATSVIPTTTTALTRAADVASVNTLSPWYNATEGTLYTESVIARQNSVGGLQIGFLSNGTTSSINTFYRATGATGAVVSDAGAVQADLSPTGVLPANTIAKIALGYKANDFAASGNGDAVTTDLAGTVPTGINVFLLGPGVAVGGISGYLRRITYYPRRLSNAELQAITT